MIRLGSLAGYPFDGPRLLGGWTPPAEPGVYAILCRPSAEARPDEFAVIDVDHSDDLSEERFPFRHRRAACWIRRAGDRWKIYICMYQVPGGLRSHREQIVRELNSIYRPGCADQQYAPEWKPEWIGNYVAPTTGPLTTPRRADGEEPSA